MKLKSKQKKLRQLGQGTTEYVMLIAVLAGIILSLAFAFQKRLKLLAEGQLGNYIEQNFFNPSNLHKLPTDLSKRLSGN